VRKLWVEAKKLDLDEDDVHDMLKQMKLPGSVKEIPKASFDTVLAKLGPYRDWAEAQFIAKQEAERLAAAEVIPASDGEGL
jgi:hypothetical protein